MKQHYIKVTEKALKDNKYKPYHKMLRKKLKELNG